MQDVKKKSTESLNFQELFVHFKNVYLPFRMFLNDCARDF